MNSGADLSDGESFGSFDDAVEEDKGGGGTDQMQIITPTEDGGEQVEIIDRPMKKAAYKNSYPIMKEEKKRLINEEHVIIKTVKSQNKHVVGGKVVGAPNSINKDRTGTIIEVCAGDVYLIQWDDEDMLDCQMERNTSGSGKKAAKRIIGRLLGTMLHQIHQLLMIKLVWLISA